MEDGGGCGGIFVMLTQCSCTSNQVLLSWRRQNEMLDGVAVGSANPETPLGLLLVRRHCTPTI